MRRLQVGLAALALLVLVPAMAFAQASITGVVKDASGAVLPGVTVEASSPVLIEKTRSAVSDGSGQYRIVDLRAGTYSVTFTLTGFSTVKRDGIELSGQFTAAINADMKVGALEETITVSGETPIVDTQSVRRQVVISDEVIKSMPAARAYAGMMMLIPATITQAGANLDVQITPGMLVFGGAGGRNNEARLQVDGLNTGAAFNGGGVSSYVPDIGNAQEIATTTSGGLGEAEVGGPSFSIVPKTGGNAMKGSFYASGVTSGMVGSNYTDDAQGRRPDVAPGASRRCGTTTSASAARSRKTRCGTSSSSATRVATARCRVCSPTRTWQSERVDVRRRHQPSGEAGRQLAQWRGACHRPADVAQQVQHLLGRAAPVSGRGVPGHERRLPPVEVRRVHLRRAGFVERRRAARRRRLRPARISTRTASACSRPRGRSPVTNKLLLEAGVGTYLSRWGGSEMPGNPSRDLVRVTEACPATTGCAANGNIAGLQYRSENWAADWQGTHSWRASASYVTGANSMKFGYQGGYLVSNIQNCHEQPAAVVHVQQRRADAVHRESRNTSAHKDRGRYDAFYAQDQITRGRLTLQGAVRWDHAWSWFPAVDIGGVQIPAADDLVRRHEGSAARSGRRRQLQGHHAAPRCGLRRVRQREDRAQGQRRPLSRSRAVEQQLRRQPSVDAAVDDGRPQLDRQQQELRDRLQPVQQRGAEPGDDRKHRHLRGRAVDVRHGEPGHAVRHGAPERLGRASWRLGHRRQRAAAGAAARVRRTRLQPPLARQLHDRRQPRHPGQRLRDVLRRGADGFAAPRRRRPDDLGSLQRESRTSSTGTARRSRTRPRTTPTTRCRATTAASTRATTACCST